MVSVIILLEQLLFIILAVSVGYFFLFALFSVMGTRRKYIKSTRNHRILVIIPSYKDDTVIMDSVQSIINQNYSKDYYDIVVVSDQMTDETNDCLMSLPLILFVINPEKSSKAYALNFAINNIQRQDYDIVVVLDSDNIADNTFLDEINNAYYSGAMAIQVHRTAKNTETPISLLDAVSEEINNSIYRKGHVNMGLSSALIGSAMAFDYGWFRSNVRELKTSGEDKELELILLKEGVFIDYLDDVYVYDYKTQKEKAFYNQRRRWIAAQFNSLAEGVKWVPCAIRNMRIDYLDKIFQWMLLPRIVVLGLIFIGAFSMTFVDLSLSVKWWLLLMLLLFAFALAVPDKLITPGTNKAFRKLPLVFIMMVVNLFRIRGAGNQFIHTKKE